MKSNKHLHPRVSILMSVYNGADYVYEAVQSILKQSFTDFELIIIDDGSTDETIKIVNSFEDRRLKIIRQNNSGLTIALNNAFAIAKGDYIARQDADDISDINRLSRQVNFLDHHPLIALVGSYANIIEEQGIAIGKIEVECFPEAIRKLLPVSNQFVHGSLMIRRNAFESIGGYRVAFRYSQDYDLVLRLVMKYKLANINEPLYFLRHRRRKISLCSRSAQRNYAALAQTLYHERKTKNKDLIDLGHDPANLVDLDNHSITCDKDITRAYHESIVNLTLRFGNFSVLRSSALQLLKLNPTRLRYWLYLATSCSDFMGKRIIKLYDRVFNKQNQLVTLNNKRITLTISALKQGGAEKVLVLLARAWSSKGNKVTVLTFDNGSDPSFYHLPGSADLFPLDISSEADSLLQGIINNFRRITVLRKAIKNSKPDVVISFIDKTNVICLLSALGLKIPVIVTEHSDPAQCDIGKLWGWLRTMTYKWFANRVVLLNKLFAKSFSNSIKSKTIVIPNPIVIEKVKENQKGERHMVVSMGRLAEEKKYSLLIMAFSRLANQYKNWDLTILGEGKERSALEKIVIEEKLEGRVFLPGAKKHPHSIVASADIYVLSSRFEGFPVALCEAMACGLPVISTEFHAGVHDIVKHNINGLVVPNEKVELLGDAIKLLMDDAALRSRFGKAGVEVAKSYSLDIVANRWDTALNEMLL